MNDTVALWFLFLDFRKSLAGPPLRAPQSAVLLRRMGLTQTEDKEKLKRKWLVLPVKLKNRKTSVEFAYDQFGDY